MPDEGSGSSIQNASVKTGSKSKGTIVSTSPKLRVTLVAAFFPVAAEKIMVEATYGPLGVPTKAGLLYLTVYSVKSRKAKLFEDVFKNIKGTSEYALVSKQYSTLSAFNKAVEKYELSPSTATLSEALGAHFRRRDSKLEFEPFSG